MPPKHEITTTNPVLAACYLGKRVTVRRGAVAGILEGVGETGVWLRDDITSSFNGMTYHPYPVVIPKEVQ